MNDTSIEQEIQAKGLTAPRVTRVDIEVEIISEHYFTAAEGALGAYHAHAGVHQGSMPSDANAKALPLLTFCVLVLRNGFTVTGESACASPDNFNADIGRKIARQNAVEKMWPLLGFRLRDQLANGLATRPDRQLSKEELQRIAQEGPKAAMNIIQSAMNIIQPFIERRARAAHEINRAYCEAIGDHSQLPWEEAPQWQRDSAIAGVRAVDEGQTPEQLHESWCAAKRADGWVYGDTKDPEAKTHPCLVPYADLPAEQRVKDHLFRAAASLIDRVEL